MKTRAAVFFEAGRPFEVHELDLDEPRAGEVLVRMAAVGICGTDLHSVKGEWVRPTPTVLGHEGAGIVEAVGQGVTGLRAGRRGRALLGAVLRRVRGLLARPAGAMPACSTARSPRARCRTGRRGSRWTARRSTAAPRPARSAERIVVSEKVALPVGEGVPLEQAALLGCAALTGVGAALFAARVEPGSSVLVVGAGGVGQFIVQGARIAGAAEIVCVDPLEARREQAARLGATQVVGPDELEELMKARAARRRGLRVRRGRRPGDDERRVPLDAERRHLRDRRASRGRQAARPRPGRLRPARARAHRHDLRLGGSGRRAAGPARPRPRRPPRPRLAARPERIPLDEDQRGDRGVASAGAPGARPRPGL